MNNQLFNTLTDTFGHVYVLTMSNRPDRRDMMERQFLKMGIPIPDSDPRIRYFYGTPFPHNDIIAQAFNTSKRGRFTKANEYDCARNHYAIIRTCYDLGYDRCLVVEDDVLFLRNADVLINYIKNVPQDFDILQGGGFTTDKRILQYMQTQDLWFRHKHVGLWNASFYALSRRGMEFYLTFMDKMLFWVADGPLYKAPLSEGVINTYASQIPLTIQADKNVVASDIRTAANDTIDYNNENEYERNVNVTDYYSPEN